FLHAQAVPGRGATERVDGADRRDAVRLRAVTAVCERAVRRAQRVRTRTVCFGARQAVADSPDLGDAQSVPARAAAERVDAADRCDARIGSGHQRGAGRALVAAWSARGD